MEIQQVQSFRATWTQHLPLLRKMNPIWIEASPNFSLEQTDAVIQRLCDDLEMALDSTSISNYAKIAIANLEVHLCIAVTSIKSGAAGKFTAPVARNLLRTLEAAILSSTILAQEVEAHRLDPYRNKFLQTASESEKALKKAIDRALDSTRKISSSRDEITSLLEQLDESRNSLIQATVEAKINTDQITSLKSTLNEAIQAYTRETDNFCSNSQQLEKQLSEVKTLEASLKALLPEATSRSLASSFEDKVQSLTKVKWFWACVFSAGIIFLALYSLRSPLSITELQQQFWPVILSRLPFISPVIWFTWFSAVQYGNSNRLQEDYAFKAAISKAFVGYKDHLDLLSKIKQEEGNSAMLNLASKTIDNLSKEPLRVFVKPGKDVSPIQEIINGIQRVRGKE